MNARPQGGAHQAPRMRQRSAAEELDRALDALHALDPGAPREQWVRAGMAAKAAGLGFEDWHRWSEGAGNYQGEADCRSVWRSIRDDGGINAATLFGMARDAGWRDRRTDRDNRLIGRTEPPARPTRKAVEARAEPPKADHRPRFDVAAVWASCTPAAPDHPYIDRKLGLHAGLRVVPADSDLSVARASIAGWLAVPMFEPGSSEPASIQFIGPDRKLTAPGPMRGWFTVGSAITEGSTVYVVEGIGQAWSAHQATRSPAVVAFGVGRFETVAKGLRERFPGARLVLVPDVGQEGKAEAVAKAIGCAWVELPADLGRNGDVNDLHQRDGMEAVAEVLGKPKEPARRFRLLTPEHFAALPPVSWAVRDVLPSEGLGAIYGKPSCGKSFLTLDLLGAVTEGRDWFGHRTKVLPVTYCALEGERGIGQRLNAYRLHHGMFPAGMRLVAQPLALLEPEDVAALAAEIKAQGGSGGIVAIDTLNRAATGADENDSRDMGRLIDAAKTLQSILGGVVLLVHHSGKDAAKGMRGHSSLLAALDTAIEVNHDETTSRRDWRVSKSKDGADGEVNPFRLEVIQLGHDADGEPVTSCVVAKDEDLGGSPVRSVKLPRGGNQRIVWDGLGELLREARDFGQAGAPVGRPCVRLESAVEHCKGRLTVPADRQAERVREAVTGLVTRGCLDLREGWLWVP